MKRVCKRPVQIDALTLCYEMAATDDYKKLNTLNYGASLDMGEFKLCRTEGRYFNNVYAIQLKSDTHNAEWGYLKFNLAQDGKQSDTDTQNEAQSNTDKDKLRKVWLSLSNETLYNGDIQFATCIEQRLGLSFYHVTTLDLCLDTPFSISPLIKSYAHNESMTTILNGKRIMNRDEDRPELKYTTSGSLNKQGKYLTVNIKQRNAIKDKSKGVTVQTYDKAAEIRNASKKQYIMDFYGNPKRLYRTEVHLNAEDTKNYVVRRGINYTPTILFDEAILEDMFFHFLESVIRFQSRKADVSWRHILGRS